MCSLICDVASSLENVTAADCRQIGEVSPTGDACKVENQISVGFSINCKCLFKNELGLASLRRYLMLERVCRFSVMKRV